MKAIVILLALLAAAKLGYQEYLFRGATRDALIGAYKEHAVQACQKDARTPDARAWARRPGRTPRPSGW